MQPHTQGCASKSMPGVTQKTRMLKDTPPHPPPMPPEEVAEPGTGSCICPDPGDKGGGQDTWAESPHFTFSVSHLYKGVKMLTSKICIQKYIECF